MGFPAMNRWRERIVAFFPIRLRMGTLAAASVVALGFCAAAAQAGPPPGREEIEATVKATLKAWESGDAEKFAAALHEQLLFAYPGDRLNKAALIETFKNYHQEKTDIKIYFGRFFVQDDRFALSYQFAATDRKTGKRQAVGTGAVGQIADGKIILLKEYYDEHVAARQAAGEIPLDEGQVFPYPASIMLVPALIN